MSRSIIMSEPPAPCNFSCSYCYVPPNFDRRKDTKVVTGNDYLKLAQKTGASEYLFWMCGIGEPFMMSYIDEVTNTLASNHKMCVITNLSYFGNAIPEQLADRHPKNFGAYWSVHWLEMKKHNVVNRVMDRVRYLTQRGVKVWPTLVMHPTYVDHLDEILDTIPEGLPLSLCRYRIGQQDLAGLDIEKHITDKYRSDPRINWGIWDITPQAWEVSGGQCEAGIKQIIVDACWRICSCHGDNNMKIFGTFPEDIDKISLSPAGLCKSPRRPCKHSVCYGVNQKFPHTFSDILVQWDEFLEQ